MFDCIYRVISLTDIFAGFIKTKITKLTEPVKKTNNYFFKKSLSWTSEFGEADMNKQVTKFI